MQSKKTKILYVITKSNFGGAQRYVYELATNLPPSLYEVVVAFGGNGILRQKLDQAGIRTHTIRSFERDVNMIKELHAMKELYALMQEERPAIVHLNSSKAGGSGAFIARLCGVKRIVFTAHGWPFNEARGLLWRSIVWFFSYLTTLLAHQVIVVSQYDHDHARMPGLRHKLSLIHTALPPLTLLSREESRCALFHEEMRQTHEADHWFVTTSEHTPNKNLPFLLHALARARGDGHTNFFLTLMGEGEQTSELKRIVNTLHLSSHVHFTGFVDEARIYLRGFDTFLLPSLKEGFPYGLLEAGAAGLGVIASNVGGIPEVITSHETGILIEPDRIETLVNALEDTLKEPRIISQYGAHLKEKVEKEYPLGEMVRMTTELYEANGSFAS